jgi:riboflavin synthase
MGIFTGLVMEIGSIRRVENRSQGAYLSVSANKVLDGTRIGDSISINGVDLTVVKFDKAEFGADVSLETLNKTTLGSFRAGDKVNLERALAVGERLGGHMVQGHIDGTGQVISVKPEGNAYRVRLRFPAELGRYIATKGSIAVDGMSLTVAQLGSDWFEIAIIPHTWEQTIMPLYGPGRRVNLEVDVLAKYVERLLGHNNESGNNAGRLTLEHLVEQGY